MTSAAAFELAGGRRLRVLEESDATELHALIAANREYLARWMPWAARQTPEDTIDFIRATRRQREDGNGFQTALVVRRRIVGVVGYHAISWPHRSISLGYWLAQAAQGHDTMTLAVRALVDHALGELRLNRVEIRADIENRRSRAIPERLGFQREGTLRQAERIGEGYRDQALYAMLAEEWIGGCAG